MNIGTVLIATVMMLSAAASIFFMKSKNSTVPMQINTGRRIYYITSGLTILLFLLLLSALLNNEFQYNYVYSNSSRDMNIAYKIAAMWAGSEGSYLLWALILNFMGLFLILKKTENEDILLAVISVTQALMFVILLVKNPFLRIWQVNPHLQPGTIPPDGQGMNPLLMDPWMVSHPPILFLGYASSTVVFAYAIYALVRKEYDAWIKNAYRWVIFSMLTLGLGIFMGAYWAYKVLGWGGYWGWDPVENSSLVPWIICVALMHGMMLQQRKHVLKKTNLLLALLYFILVFYSTFLTRSGVLSEFSVHSFQKSDLQLYLGIILALLFAASAVIYIRRFRSIRATELSKDQFNLENRTVYGIIVLIFYAVIILIGTSMPILSSLAGLQVTPVTEKFYNNISIPMGLMVIISIIFSDMSSAKYSKLHLSIIGLISICISVVVSLFFSTNLTALFLSVPVGLILIIFIIFPELSSEKYLKLPLEIIGLISVCFPIAADLFFNTNITAFFFMLFSVFLVQLTIFDIYQKGKGVILSSRTAHLGIAVMVLGIIISGYYSGSEQVRVNTGETAATGGYSIRLNGFNDTLQSSIGITIGKNNSSSDISIPYYVDENLEPVYKEPHIINKITGDLYIAPQTYVFSSMNYGTEILQKGEEKEIFGYKVKFQNFIKNNMGQPQMTILASLLINGQQYTPGWSIDNEQFSYINKTIGNSGRTVSVEKIDVTHEVVMIRITPSANDKIPPDYAILDVSFKRMIWLVWLGTLLICAGLVLSMTRLVRKS